MHCSGVAFSCKRHGDSSISLSTPKDASTVDSIRQVHGSAVTNELISFEVTDQKWGFTASGYTSNANYHVKKTTILLFINHRSVESSAIKKALEQTYSTFLPKGGHPFVYLSLEIDPQRVDVNVHPTKREVNFLNEDEITEAICTHIRIKLSEVDNSRTFMTQSLLTSNAPKVPLSNQNLNPKSSHTKVTTQRNVSSTPARPYENNLVRTDPSFRKITSMLPPSTHRSSTQPPQQPSYIVISRVPTHCRLTTIKDLRATVRENMHATLTEVFASHTYVGLVDIQRRIVAIQGGVKLFLVDYGMISNEYFYQLGLTDFSNFGAIQFDPPLSISDLVRVGVKIERAENPDDEIEWDQVTSEVTKQLVSRREMLAEYFSLEISEDGELISIPLLLKGYTPSMAKLPRFLMRLGPCVNWNEEKECFRTFLRELASFYVPEQLPNDIDVRKKQADGGEGMKDDDGADEIVRRKEEITRVLEHVLFPAFRSRLVATKGLLSGVLEVADLKGLYRVFERC